MAAGRGGGWKWRGAEASAWKREQEFKTCREMPWLSSSCWFGFAWLDAEGTGAAWSSAAPAQKRQERAGGGRAGGRRGPRGEVREESRKSESERIIR